MVPTVTADVVLVGPCVERVAIALNCDDRGLLSDLWLEDAFDDEGCRLVEGRLADILDPPLEGRCLGHVFVSVPPHVTCDLLSVALPGQFVVALVTMLN